MDDALRDSIVKASQQVSDATDESSAKGNAKARETSADSYRTVLETRGLISVPGSLSAWIANWRSVNPFGLLLSVLLLNLGAPFWYNALKNLLSLRSTLAVKDDEQRIQRQENVQQSAGTAASATAGTRVAAGERGDLNAVG